MSSRDYDSYSHSVEIELPYKFDDKDYSYTKRYDFNVTIISEELDHNNHWYNVPVWVSKVEINGLDKEIDDEESDVVLFKENIIDDINDLINNIEWFYDEDYEKIKDELKIILTSDNLEYLIESYIGFSSEIMNTDCWEEYYISWSWNFYCKEEIKDNLKDIINKNKYVKVIKEDENILLKIEVNNKRIEINLNDFMNAYDKIGSELNSNFSDETKVC